MTSCPKAQRLETSWDKQDQAGQGESRWIPPSDQKRDPNHSVRERRTSKGNSVYIWRDIWTKTSEWQRVHSIRQTTQHESSKTFRTPLWWSLLAIASNYLERYTPKTTRTRAGSCGMLATPSLLDGRKQRKDAEGQNHSISIYLLASWLARQVVLPQNINL